MSRASRVASPVITDLKECADYRLSRHGDSVYVAHTAAHVSRQMVNEWLGIVWSDPQWKQPWAMITVLQEDSTYDLDLRDVPIPPPERRAVMTAVVSPKSLHRMVVNTMGIAMKISHRFQVISCSNLDEALQETRAALANAGRSGRNH
jgi:hypothetical protein